MITNDAKCLQSFQMIILIKLLVELKFLLMADPIYLLFTKYSWIFSTMANFPKYPQWLLDQAPWILVQLKFQVVADPETHLLNPALNFWSFTRETFYLLCCRRWNFLENYNHASLNWTFVSGSPRRLAKQMWIGDRGNNINL